MPWLLIDLLMYNKMFLNFSTNTSLGITFYQQQQLVLFSVCESVCVILGICGPDDTYCGGKPHVKDCRKTKSNVCLLFL